MNMQYYNGINSKHVKRVCGNIQYCALFNGLCIGCVLSLCAGAKTGCWKTLVYSWCEMMYILYIRGT